MAKFAKVLVTNVKKLWKVESSTILTFKVKRLKEFFSIFSLKNIEKGEQLLILSFFDIFDFQCSVFPHLRPAGNIISHSLQMRVLLENTTFSKYKSCITNAGIIRGSVLYEEIRYVVCYEKRAHFSTLAAKCVFFHFSSL